MRTAYCVHIHVKNFKGFPKKCEIFQSICIPEIMTTPQEYAQDIINEYRKRNNGQTQTSANFTLGLNVDTVEDFTFRIDLAGHDGIPGQSGAHGNIVSSF